MRLNDPLFAFSSILDGFDLSVVHFVACLLGVFMALIVMQLWSNRSLIADDCVISYWSRRVGLCALALAMLWSLAYSTTKGWQPWPPDVAAKIAVDLVLLSPIILAWRRRAARLSAAKERGAAAHA